MARATARHILVSTEAKCNELKAAIEGGADFAQVAKENSTCPSSRQGGDLGSFGPGQMVKEFDTVVFSAPLNVVQGPVKTQFGYHLLEVTAARTDPSLSPRVHARGHSHRAVHYPPHHPASPSCHACRRKRPVSALSPFMLCMMVLPDAAVSCVTLAA